MHGLLSFGLSGQLLQGGHPWREVSPSQLLHFQQPNGAAVVSREWPIG